MIGKFVVALLVGLLGTASLRAAPAITLQEEWRAEWKAPGSDPEVHPEQLAVAPDGSVYVTGTVFRVESTKLDICTVKFNSEGKFEWVRYVDKAIRAKKKATYVSSHYYNEDRGIAVVVGADGRVYVAGHSADEVRSGEYSLRNPCCSEVSFDVLLTSYAPDGKTVWTARHSPYRSKEPGTKTFTEKVSALLLDPRGGLYVCGTGSVSGLRNTSFEYRPLVLKYDLEGHLLWGRRPDIRNNGAAILSCDAAALDAEGNLRIACVEYRTEAKPAFPWWNRSRVGVTTVVFTPDGRQKEIHHIKLSNTRDLGDYDLALDPQGNLFVAHDCLSRWKRESCPLGNRENLFWCFDREGRQRWTLRPGAYARGSHPDDEAELYADGSGNAYIRDRRSGPDSWICMALDGQELLHQTVEATKLLVDLPHALLYSCFWADGYGVRRYRITDGADTGK